MTGNSQYSILTELGGVETIVESRQHACFDDPLKESPCKKCKFFGTLPAIKCIERSECPLNDSKDKPILTTSSNDKRETKIPCKFEGCDRLQSVFANSCQSCKTKLSNRKFLLGIPPELIYLKDCPARGTYQPYKWEKRVYKKRKNVE